MKQPAIAVSMGDPSGIGPEVIIKALSDPVLRDQARWIIVGDRTALQAAEASIGTQLPIDAVLKDMNALKRLLPLGSLHGDNGRAAIEYVREATGMCLRGEVQAMVTGPISKETVTMAAIPFTGHTEYIADLCGVDSSRMLLINDKLMVLHVTTHCALRQACDVEVERVLSTLRLGHATLARLGRSQGAIGLCGLNPHAGEAGLFGDEEMRILAPAVRMARDEGIGVSGPFPADTIFFRALKGEFAMVVAMYHDQGHIPMKLIDFENTVNVSIGLPIIRTSVDHGTAFEIAGKNLANPSNMKAAMQFAIDLAVKRGDG